VVADGSAWSPSKTLRFDPSAKAQVHRSCRAEMGIEPFKVQARAMLDPPYNTGRVDHGRSIQKDGASRSRQIEHSIPPKSSSL
jgi:hypothetical protein